MCQKATKAIQQPKWEVDFFKDYRLNSKLGINFEVASKYKCKYFCIFLEPLSFHDTNKRDNNLQVDSKYKCV